MALGIIYTAGTKLLTKCILVEKNSRFPYNGLEKRFPALQGGNVLNRESDD